MKTRNDGNFTVIDGLSIDARTFETLREEAKSCGDAPIQDMIQLALCMYLNCRGYYFSKVNP